MLPHQPLSTTPSSVSDENKFVRTKIVFQNLPMHVGQRPSTNEQYTRQPLFLPMPRLTQSPDTDLRNSFTSRRSSPKKIQEQLPALQILPEYLNEFSDLKKSHIIDVISLEEFKNASTYREQCHILAQHLRRNPNDPEFTLEELAHIFSKFNGHSVKNQLDHSLTEVRPGGRPPLLPNEVKEFMYILIQKRYDLKDPVSIPELTEIISEKFGITISFDSLGKIISRDSKFHITIGEPMEKNRVSINSAELVTWFLNLKQAILNIPRYFVLNMDETGLDDWVDSRNVHVLVPMSNTDAKISIPVQRACKRATLTGCIAADGSALKPLVILSAKTIAEDIIQAGFTEDKVLFIYQSHGFMTKMIFEFWCKEIFFPYIMQKRNQFHYNGVAILLMDQFSGHIYASFEEDCVRTGVIVIPLIPHTSHLAQPLDQLLFAAFKLKYTTIKYNKLGSATSNRIVKILKAWFQTITADMITSTFTAAGIVPDRVSYDGTVCCCIDLQRSVHLKDFKLEKKTTEEAQGEYIPSTEPAIAAEKIDAQSPPKGAIKRFPITKIDQPNPEKTTDTSKKSSAASKPPDHPESGSATPKTQLTPDQMIKKSPKKP
jgi:hypothetical protein